MEELTKYALEVGHRRIAYVHGKHNAVTDNRLTGFYRAMKDADCAVVEEYMEESEYQNARKCYKAVQRLLKLPVPPTCILVSDDLAAVGAADAIRESGLRVGEDVSLGGYDGHQLLQLLRPKLTTIKQDTRMIGSKAAEILIESIDEPNTAGVETVVVKGELLKGETMRPPKA